MRLSNNIGIIIIILAFICANAIFLNFYKILWWDSAVYIGMGKYIYSFGNAGLWEATRPVVWPLILGFLWKTGLNTVLIGRILEMIFGSLCILLVYLIGKKLFNGNTGLLASIFLALSPTFFFFNGIMLTEIVSTFFSLYAIYFFIDKKYFVSGLFFGISFMTRFLQLFVFFAAFFTILICLNKKSVKNLTNIFLGFIVAIAPFLILNQILYNNILFPFLQQIFLSNNSGWFNYQPIYFYFISLFKENFLYLLSIFGILLIFKSKDMKKIIVATTFILLFIFFNSINQKEMRFLIVLLPYMYLLTSFSITHFLDKAKNIFFKKIILAFIIVSFILSITNISIYYKIELNKRGQYEALRNRFEVDYVKGKIWISSPLIAVSSDKKIDNLIYYPVFNEEKKKELIQKAKNADFIFVDSCDMACRPLDVDCENDRNEVLSHLKRQLEITYSSQVNKCNQFVFQNKLIS